MRRKEAWSFSLTALLSLALLLSSCANSQSQTGAVPAPEKRGVAENGPFNLSVQIAPEDCIFIQARINNSEPLWFILDTGADRLLINSRLVSRLGLKPEGRTDVGGAGVNRVEGQRATGISFEFAGTSIPEQTATVVALNDLEEDVGREVAGIIGFPLFSRYAVEIDFATRRVRAFDPDSFRYTGRGEVVPLEIENNHPHVMARISLPGRKSLEGKFLVDTGAPSVAGMLTRPFIESHRLLKANYKTISIPGYRGLGGEIKMLLGRGGALELGRFVFRSPVVGFFQDEDGFGARMDVDGLIGNEILRRFKVIFDYPHKRLILEPNAYLAEPFETNMSGFRLRAGGGDVKTLKAYAVMENSPASEAGLRDRDELTTIDGQPALNFTLPQLYHMFKQAGREYLLTVKRDEKLLSIKLKTRRLI
jgi:predicted aspartyl protease